MLRAYRLARVVSLCLVAGFCWPASATASTVLYRTDAELIALSERVVHGRVLRQRTERPDPNGPIYTVTTIAVLEDFTGIAGDVIEVRELGGAFGGEIMYVGGAVQYVVGSETVVMLERGPRGLRSAAMGLSKFDVVTTGARRGALVRSVGDTAIVSGGGAAASVAERTLDDLRALARTVRGVAPRRNRSAEVMEPDPASVTASFTLLLFGNGLAPRWVEADTGTPVNWYRNTSAPSPLLSGSSDSEIQTALSAWTAPASASIVLNFAGTTSQTEAKGPWTGISNGNGVITYEDPGNEISGSTLAIGGGFAFFGSGGTVNGTTFNRYIRGYVIFQNAANLSASFRQSQNFTRVMQHEIGHAIGLGHSEVGDSAIMYFACCSANTPVSPNLGADDLAGLVFIYPASGPLPTCTYSLSPTSVSVGNGASSGNLTVTTQDGCAWSVTNNSFGIVTSTSPSSGTGSATVSYAIAANGATAQRAGTLVIGGQTFTITQAAACSYTLTAYSVTVGTAASAGSVGVATQAGCAWTAASNSAFVTLPGATSGTGSGSVPYSIAANGAVSQRIGTLTIAGQPFSITQFGSGPTVALDRTSLRFGATVAGGAFVTQTGSQTFRMSQTGTGAVTFTATPNQPWVSVSPASGTLPATVTVTVAPHASLPAAGSATATVALATSGSGNALSPLTVGLRTIANGTSASPFGAFDTPADGATGVNGSVAVTGWVLDDVQVNAVRIYRDPVAGEGPALVFVGNAVFVDGARPDVAASYATTPRFTRAGWGYLMLTNFLPNQGNGMFRIHAVAEDAEGRSTTLGVKTITGANASSTAPFGAIDSPAQGETVSGIVNNFGWVLAPGGARADIPGGGVVNVVIDGAAVGSPTGWTNRSDLTSLFPTGYSQLASTLAVYSFNSASFADGVHTIAWGVVASNGQSAGIGSRYFTIASGGTGALTMDASSGAVSSHSSTTLDGGELMAPPRAGARATRAVVPLSDEIAAAPEAAGVRGRRGFDEATSLQPLARDDGGRATLHGEEMDRFELALDGFGPFSGYLRSGGQLAPLPIGSRLEESTGVFTWMPGVAFIGQYDLVFVRWAAGRAVARHEVRIVLHPKGSNRVGPQVVIDTPSDPVASGLSRKDLAQPFLVAGWAVDLDDSVGTGVAALHVWAYPVTASGWDDPIFLGATAYGGIRPDVAAIYGERFRESGYGLFVDGLAPGTYDLAVFAWSTVRNGFAPAKVVRVRIER